MYRYTICDTIHNSQEALLLFLLQLAAVRADTKSAFWNSCSADSSNWLHSIQWYGCWLQKCAGQSYSDRARSPACALQGCSYGSCDLEVRQVTITTTVVQLLNAYLTLNAVYEENPFQLLAGVGFSILTGLLWLIYAVSKAVCV